LHTDEEWDSVLAVNLDAAFTLAREFGKEMIKREGEVLTVDGGWMGR